MLKKIPVSEVRVGMFLQELSGSWLDHPFWKNKFVIEDENDLKRLRESKVKEVWIDVAKGDDVAAAVPAPPPANEPPLEPSEPSPVPVTRAPFPPPRKLSVGQAAERAHFIRHQAKQQMTELYQQVRLGKAITTGHLGDLVEDISVSVMDNPGVFISLSRLKNKDDYTYMHSVTVCALMVSLGRQLGLDDEQLRDAGMAGLLHDMGKALIPIEILNKPGALTNDEFAVVKEHPRKGWELLMSGSGASDVAKDVCLHHHERFDGKGYPEKVAADKQSVFVRMSSVCDVYDAITSNRPYKAGWDPAESIRRMAVWSNEGHFDPRVFQAFVKSIGIYPTGSLIKLQSGRLAVVVEQHPTSALTPLVKAFFSTKSNLHIPPEIIDLSKSTERIVSRELPEDWKIKNLDEIWTEVVRPA
jgi:HD-GYP domain-containing protein (c-di-GMP phosphodiesterase class II)